MDWRHSLWSIVSPCRVQVRMTTVLLKNTYALAPPPGTFERIGWCWVRSLVIFKADEGFSRRARLEDDSWMRPQIPWSRGLRQSYSFGRRQHLRQCLVIAGAQ